VCGRRQAERYQTFNLALRRIESHRPLNSSDAGASRGVRCAVPAVD
jgi:hypothetical protein